MTQDTTQPTQAVEAVEAVEAVDPNASVLQHYTKEDIKIIVDLVAPSLRNKETGKVYEGELRLFLKTARAVGLDPLRKQVYAIMRWDGGLQRERLSIQTGIDGFRAIAARHKGIYAGQTAPQWCGKDGKWVDVWLHDEHPAAARVSVLRSDFQEPCPGIARWDAYVQTGKDGSPTKFWKQMGPEQLAKCAEALALRKAFPEDLSGLYTHEEMQQADNSPRDAEVVDDGSRAAKSPQAGAQRQQSRLSARARAANEEARAQAAEPVEASVQERPAQAATEPAAQEAAQEPPADPHGWKEPLTDEELAAAVDPANTDFLHEWRVWGALSPPPWDEWKDIPIAKSPATLAKYPPSELVKGEEGGGRHTVLASIIEKTARKYKGADPSTIPEGAFKADYCLAVMKRRYEYTEETLEKRAKAQEATRGQE